MMVLGPATEFADTRNRDIIVKYNRPFKQSTRTTAYTCFIFIQPYLVKIIIMTSIVTDESYRENTYYYTQFSPK